jgi:regulator of sigma E protease
MNPREEIPAEVAHRAYYNQPVWKRIVVILAGPFVNLVIAFVIITAILWSQGAYVTSHGQQVPSHTVAAGPLQAPASSYLKPGDTIVGLDGITGLSVQQITRQIGSHRCAGPLTAGCRAATPVTITVRRAGKLIRFSIYPRYDPASKRMRIGFAFDALKHSYGPLGAAGQSVSQMWYVTHTTVTRIVTLFEPKARKQLHGVVGTFDVVHQEFGFSTTDALYTLALISLSLAVVNLFPFLPLDGGHVFWAVAEKLRGRRISFDVMERASVVGFLLVALLFVIGLSNDITTLSGSGFNVR